MDILRMFEALKVFVKDEKDTVIGLLLFEFLGLAALRYLVIENFDFLKEYTVYLAGPLVLIILAIWIYNRRISVSNQKFSIAIAPFNLLILNTKDVTGEGKRSLRSGLVDYIHTSLNFHKEHTDIDKYIEVIRLPNRIKPTLKTIRRWVKKLGAGLIIWGDAYYDEKYIYFKPRFEFSREPRNVYYRKFKSKINELDTFKIEISDEVGKQSTELSQLMNYIAFLGLMFRGIEYTHEKRFEEGKACFEYALKLMRKKALRNKSLSDIYLATRFFYARNFHKWGNYLLEHEDDIKAMKIFDKGAKSFFKRSVEMQRLHDVDEEADLEHSLLYGIHLLMKEGKNSKAEKKLDSLKRRFGVKNRYLYYLYKGLLQKESKKAISYFDKAIKLTSHADLCYDEIADYFFSKGKFKESIKYFEKRFGISSKQTYTPDLLEEAAHEKLSKAYLHELNLFGAVKEKITEIINRWKNESKSERLRD